MAQSSDHAPEPGADRPTVDLERVTADLEGVEAALKRLDDGTYWTDEVTGEPIPDHVLSVNPVARRAAPPESEA